MKEKECKILGYQKCTIKDSQEEMLRICLAILSTRENYVGNESTYIFLPFSNELKTKIDNYFRNDDLTAYYETTDNIVTGKTKVSKIIIK